MGSIGKSTQIENISLREDNYEYDDNDDSDNDVDNGDDDENGLTGRPEASSSIRFSTTSSN